MNVELKRISSNTARELRRIVLKKNQPDSEFFYPGDDDELTFHGGLFVNNELVAIASMFKQEHPLKNVKNSWRLRGMAVSYNYQKNGFGTKVLKFCIENIKNLGAEILWCNARLEAIGFYKKYGFKIISDLFEIPNIGPHYIMEIELIN
jgi:ribosomal protein S18 acetylase RimI-like enzyme